MFRTAPRPVAPPAARRLSPLRRAALFGGGLVCLWGALQLAPLPATRPAERAVAPRAAIAPAASASPAPDTPAPTATEPTATEPATAEPAAPAPTAVAPNVVAPTPTDTATSAAAPATAELATAARPPVAGRAPRPQASERPAVAARPRRSDYRLLRPGNVVAFVLLAAGGALAYHLHRRKRPAAPAGAAPALTVLGELTLGPGQAVRLVRVRDEVLVLGVTTAGISLLHRYPYVAPEPAADGAAPADAPAFAGLPFADVLRQFAPSAHA